MDEVYPVLLDDFRDLELWYVGGRGAAESLRTHRGFSRRGVRIFDHVDSIQPLLRQSALTINPIHGNRGSCMKVAESLAAGRVCVSTREGARGYLDFDLPSLVTCEQVRDFAAPLRKLLGDVSSRRNLELLDEDRRHLLSWDYSRQRLLAMYAQLETRLYEQSEADPDAALPA